AAASSTGSETPRLRPEPRGASAAVALRYIVPMKLLPTLTLSAAAVVASLATLPAQSGGVKAFTGARVVDGTDRAPIENATIVVRDGKIVAVGPADRVTVPAGAERVSLTGKTVIP